MALQPVDFFKRAFHFLDSPPPLRSGWRKLKLTLAVGFVAVAGFSRQKSGGFAPDGGVSGENWQEKSNGQMLNPKTEMETANLSQSIERKMFVKISPDPFGVSPRFFKAFSLNSWRQLDHFNFRFRVKGNFLDFVNHFKLGSAHDPIFFIVNPNSEIEMAKLPPPPFNLATD